MITKLVQRLGFQPSVPVALVDDWHIPVGERPPIELAPRGGEASCLVDEFGRVQITDESWSLELTLAAGARWVAASQAERITQALLPPGVVETTIGTPAGPITQRIAAAVIDARPVAVVEVENTGGVAIAVGIVVRPLRLDGRGHLPQVTVSPDGLAVDGVRRVRFERAPASVAAQAGADGDLLKAMPEADDGESAAQATCRSGGAQGAAVWPLAHTATLRVVVELAGPTSDGAAVPSTEDVNRGWSAHLRQGMRVEVDDLEVADHIAAAVRQVLTGHPNPTGAPLAVTAMSEAGFGRDAGRFFERLERCDDDDAVVRSLARWAQLGEEQHQLGDLDVILGRLAQAAHRIARGQRALAGPMWLPDALAVLGERLHQIDQPEVSDRVRTLAVNIQPVGAAADRLGALTQAIDKRGVWSDTPMDSAGLYLRAARATVLDDAGASLGLLPDVPTPWRGRSVNVFDLPVASGTISFGLRWHGPRPALLWEADLATDALIEVSAPGIDPGFTSTERQGEALLADPGWSATS